MTDLVRELMNETRWNNIERVKELLKNPELDLNVAVDGRRAIADAIQAQDISMLAAYLDSGKVDLSLWIASFDSLEQRDAKPFECFSIQCMKEQKKKHVDTTISALMFAIEWGDSKKFKMLLKHGADPLEVTCKGKQSVLSRICSHGNHDMLKDLVAKRVQLDFTEENCFGKSALKALIARKKDPKKSHFFYYDFCNEATKEKVGEDEYLLILEYVLLSTRKATIVDSSVDIVPLIIEAIEDQRCMMTEKLAESLLSVMPKNKFRDFNGESLILAARKGLIEMMKFMTLKGASVNAADAHGKTAFVYLLEKIGNFVNIEGFGFEADFTSYLLTSSCKNIRVVCEWISRKPELRRLFEEHYWQVGWDSMLELFKGEYSAELVTCFDDYIFPLLQNEAFVKELPLLVLKSPQVSFKAFIDKLIAAKENGLLRSWISRAESLIPIAIENKNINAAIFLIDSWHVDVTAQFDGKVPLYLAAEKSDCNTLQRLLAVAKPNSFDKAILAHHLRHSPCNCIELFATSFDFVKKISRKNAIEVYKQNGLTELVNKLTPAASKPQNKRNAAVANLTSANQQPSIETARVEQTVIQAILSGESNEWKKLKPIIHDHSEQFLESCFKQSASGVSPIDQAKKNKIRLIKLFASLSKYAKADYFECFISNFEACFPGVFERFVKRYGAYLIVSSCNFLVTHLLMSKYKIPIDARVHSFQGDYSFPARVFKHGFNSLNAVFLANFDVNFAQLNYGNQSLRKSFKFSKKHQPNLSLMKRFTEVGDQDLVAVLIETCKASGTINVELFKNVDWTLIAKNIRLLPANLVKLITLLALRGGVDPLLKNGKKTWLTHYFYGNCTFEDCKLLKNAGVQACQLIALTDDSGKKYFERNTRYGNIEDAFPNFSDYRNCDWKPFNQVNLRKVVSDAYSCMICRSEYQAEESVLLLPCKHMFHFECLLPLKQRSNWGYCPYCNTYSNWYMNSNVKSYY